MDVSKNCPNEFERASNFRSGLSKTLGQYTELLLKCGEHDNYLNYLTLIVTVVNMYLDRVTDTRFSGQLFRLSGQLLTISRFS